MQRTEVDIREAVAEQLRADARVPYEGIQVLVTDGTVILRGSVPSYRAKWAAGEAARRVRGVYDVENELQVLITAPSDDERVANDIRSAMMRDADVDSSGIHVDVHEGRVKLQGTVSSGWERSRAEEDARWTRGVVSVVNQITVVPTHSRQDAELAVHIASALQRDAAVDPAAIQVTVADKHATLSGVVRSWAERNAALDAALHVPGVVDVRDELALQYAQT
ncbi:MAG: BON domain-containing protein [Anaerolineae bacterium]